LPIEIENPTRPLVFASVQPLASCYKLTGYDAAHLELALRHNLSMAALGNALAQAARAAGVNWSIENSGAGSGNLVHAATRGLAGDHH
jgi:hypothetical protein